MGFPSPTEESLRLGEDEDVDEEEGRTSCIVMCASSLISLDSGSPQISLTKQNKQRKSSPAENFQKRGADDPIERERWSFFVWVSMHTPTQQRQLRSTREHPAVKNPAACTYLYSTVPTYSTVGLHTERKYLVCSGNT